MKVELLEITKEMAGSEELAAAIMTNFNRLNDMADKRDGLILSKIGTVKRDILNKLDDFGHKNDENIVEVKSMLLLIMNSLGIDPRLIQE